MRRELLDTRLAHAIAKKKTMSLILTLIQVYFVFLSNVSAQEQLVLSLGQSYFIKSPAHEKVYLSHGRSLKVHPKPTGIQLKTKRTGETLVTLGPKTLNVVVISNELMNSYQKLKRLETQRMGWKIVIKDKQLQLTGEIYRFDDLLEISELLMGLPYKLNAIISGDVEKRFKDYLSDQAAKKDLQMPYIDFSLPVTAYLPSSLKSQKQAYESWLGKFGLSIKWSKNFFEDRPLIRIKVHFIEANKVFQKKLGFSWNSQAQYRVLPSRVESGDLSVLLKWMKQTGNGRVLAEPSLTAKSNESAQLLIGGEIPLKIVTPESSRIEWKEYGLSLKFKPQVDSTNTIKLSVDLKLSSLDLSLGSQDTPAIKTHHFKSHLISKHNSTLLLSEVSQLLRGQSQNELPGFGSLPLLGELFKSKDYVTQKSEAFVFVSVHFVESKHEQKFLEHQRTKALKNE